MEARSRSSGSAPPSPSPTTTTPSSSQPRLSPSLPTPPLPVSPPTSTSRTQVQAQSPPTPLPTQPSQPAQPHLLTKHTTSSLRTKINLPPSDSPRTTASNRRRLGGLFADLGFGSSSGAGSPLRARAAPPAAGSGSTPARRALAMSTASSEVGSSGGRPSPGQTPASASGFSGVELERLGGIVCFYFDGDFSQSADTSAFGESGSPAASPTKTRGKGKGRAREGVVEWDEGCFVDASSETSLSLELGQEKLELLDLPDELLLLIFLHLPSTIPQLHTLALTSKHMYNLSRAPVLWARAFDATPGFELSKGARERGVGVVDLPGGRWEGVEWAGEEGGENDEETGSEAGLPTLPANAIPIHYPTLYRSRHTLPTLIRSLSPTHRPRCDVLTSHTDSAYCLQFEGQWLVTGSRDRSVRVWRLPTVEDPCVPTAGATEVVLGKTIPDAHAGSILGLQFTLSPTGHGLLATASSDSTCTLWSIFLPPAPSTAPPEVHKVLSLQHASAVLDVCLTPGRVVTGTKDSAVRFYSLEGWDPAHPHVGARGELELIREARVHRGPVNCVYGPRGAAGNEVVSASGDGTWVVWDALSGRELRRGAGDGRGLACVAWEGDYIVTGDNECLVKLYDANTCELLRVFEGHTNLVRTVALDPYAGIVVSGSYDKRVRLWDLHTGHLIKSPHEVQDSLVFDVQFSTNRLISASHDNSVHVLTWGGGLPYASLFV
ncbi:hypothetical protein IAT38_006509 [Cryptococcus sp. DSM 104549]